MDFLSAEKAPSEALTGNGVGKGLRINYVPEMG